MVFTSITAFLSVGRQISHYVLHQHWAEAIWKAKLSQGQKWKWPTGYTSNVGIVQKLLSHHFGAIFDHYNFSKLQYARVLRGPQFCKLKAASGAPTDTPVFKAHRHGSCALPGSLCPAPASRLQLSKKL